MTAGMLRSPDPAEREAPLAHERAHLVGRHHLLSAVTDLAATSAGDRRPAATAIARAALAAADAARPGGNRNLLLSVNSGPVPRRVRALLGPAPARPRGHAPQATAVLLAGTVAPTVTLPRVGLRADEYVEHAGRAAQGP